MNSTQELVRIGGMAWDASQVLLILAGAAVALLVILLAGALVMLARRGRETGVLVTELAELKGRIQSISETLLQGQSRLALAVDQKLDGVTHRLGQDLS